MIFIQGDTRVTLQRLSISRVNIAFLDACHTYKDVLIESNFIADRQKSGDIIIFDDYNTKYFKGLVKAVDFFSKSKKYEIEIIKGLNYRDYIIAKKI